MMWEGIIWALVLMACGLCALIGSGAQPGGAMPVGGLFSLLGLVLGLPALLADIIAILRTADQKTLNMRFVVAVVLLAIVAALLKQV